MLGSRGFLPALTAVVCAGACPPARGQTELLPLPGGSAPAALPGVPPRPEGHAVGVYRLAVAGDAGGEELSPADLEEALRTLAASAPGVRSAVLLELPAPACDLEDDGCFSLKAAARGIDLAVVATVGRAGGERVARARLLDAASGKRLSEGQGRLPPGGRAELQAGIEALGCKLLLPGGCQGTVIVDLDLPEMQLVVDGAPQARGDDQEPLVRLALPVGLHHLRVAAGQQASLERALAVLRKPEPGVALYARQFEQGGLGLFSGADLPLGMDGNAGPPRSQRPKAPGARWLHPAGYAAAGLGALALGLGAWELQRGRSLAGDAGTAYDRNGGYYRPSDLATLNSSRSATTAGRVAGLAGLGLLAAGAALRFAF